MKLLSFAIPALALLLGAACGNSHNLRAGAAIADITPQQEWPLPLIGNFGYSPATAANDPLSVRAIVLESGEETIAIAVVDSCYLPQEVADDAKKRASERSGIPADRILLSATHTHSAPPSSPMLDWKPGGPPEVEPNMQTYTERLRNGVAEAVANAHSRLEPAEVGWGKVDIPEELHNRRWFMKEGTIPPDPFGGMTDKVQMNPPRMSENLIKAAGPTDPELYVVSLRSLDGVPLALWATYSLHYVGGVPSGKVSADYFGEFARRIAASMRQEGAGDDFVGILANGTSGDVNNIDFQHERPPAAPFERIHQVAERVARGAYETYKSIGHHRQLDFGMIERELTLQRRKPTPEGYEQAKLTLAEPDESELPRRARPYAERAIALYDGPDETTIKLQALHIGPLAVCAIPFEVFTQIGLDIKDKSPFEDTFTVELANGWNGYLPTPEQHELGGYETWLGTNFVQKDASVKITEQLLGMLEELHAPEP
jgi:hypothetical protein